MSTKNIILLDLKIGTTHVNQSFEDIKSAIDEICIMKPSLQKTRSVILCIVLIAVKIAEMPTSAPTAAKS